MNKGQTLRASWSQKFKISNITADDIFPLAQQIGKMELFVTPQPDKSVKISIKEVHPRYSSKKRNNMNFIIPENIWEAVVRHVQGKSE